MTPRLQRNKNHKSSGSILSQGKGSPGNARISAKKLIKKGSRCNAKSILSHINGKMLHKSPNISLD